MAEKQKTELNEEQTLAFLQDIVEKIRTEEDPLELNKYRRLFRKAVPFTLRSYFAAYLLKQINSGKLPGKLAPSTRNDRSGRQSRRDRGDRIDRGDRNERNDRNDRGDRIDREDRSGRQEGRSRDGRQEESRRAKASEGRGSEVRLESAKAEPRPVLADDVSTTLFVSIGRNRRVYPRDLIGLILQNVEMDREHIGDIRVLDNYSFVQVITEDAEKIIQALNEFEYRGRKLAVSYSRKREDSAETRDASEDDVSSQDRLADDGASLDGEPSKDAYSEGDGESSIDEDFSGDDDSNDAAESADSWVHETDPADDEENNGNV